MQSSDTTTAPEMEDQTLASDFYHHEPQLILKPGVTEEELPVVAPNETKLGLHWPAFSFIIGCHILALAGFFTFSWSALAVCLFLHWFTGGVGITLGYHRLLTHRSFQAPKIVEYVLAIIASLACQGGPIAWVSVHRIHHAKSDKPGDPHSPKDGFFWAHMGWCIHKSKLIDDYKEYSKFSPDLAQDPVHRFLNSYFMLWTVLLAIGLYVWGGWSFVVWGIFVRTVLVYHTTWLVNSATHVWGYRTYQTPEGSTNLWWVALLSFGEGWHNNHHAFQTSARHGLQWWELDTTYLMIKLLEKLGLAKDIKIPSPYLLKQKTIAL